MVGGGGRFTVYDPPYPLGGDGLGVIFHLDQNKLPLTAVLPVQVNNRVGRCAGASKGIKDYALRVLFANPVEYPFDNINVFLRVKTCITTEMVGFIGTQTCLTSQGYAAQEHPKNTSKIRRRF